MKDSPSRGLGPKSYIPLVLGILAIAGIPIIVFLRTGFGTSGSAIQVQTGSSGPPPMIAAAVTELRGRITRNPKDIDALTALAGLEMEAGRLDTASGLLAQAVAAAPHNARIRAAYAEVLNTQGHSKEARAQLDSVLTHDPHNADAHYERGIINERLGEHAAADEDFREFLAHAPGNDPRRAALVGRSGAKN